MSNEKNSNIWISEEKINFYRENGFVQVESVLTTKEIEELTQFMEETMSEGASISKRTTDINSSYYRVLNQKVNVWRDHAGMARYTTHNRLAGIAMELSGSEGIRLFHDHALWKMPGDSKETPWHQDFPYWPMEDPVALRTLSAWIPLDDVDEMNGCMMFVPGSYKAGKLRGISLTEPQDIFQYVDGTAFDKTKPVKVPLKKGSCTFHSGLTFHFAYANRTENPRRVLAIIYMPDGTRFDGKRHIITDGLGLTKGDKLQGGLFPLLATSENCLPY